MRDVILIIIFIFSLLFLGSGKVNQVSYPVTVTGNPPGGMLKCYGANDVSWLETSGVELHIVPNKNYAVINIVEAGSIVSTNNFYQFFNITSPRTFTVNFAYCDVNGDGIVDSGDLAAVDNDNTNYVTGPTRTDVNRDGIVDCTDLSIVDNMQSRYGLSKRRR